MTSWNRLYLSLLLLGAGLLPAQSPTPEKAPARYIVELTTEPVAGQVVRARLPGGLRGPAAARHRAGVRAEQGRLKLRVEARQAKVLTTVDTVANALIVEADEATAASLRLLPGVKRVVLSRPHKMLMDSAVLVHKAAEAWDQIGVDNAGRGVKVGIIDSGITIKHAAFQDDTLSAPEGWAPTGANYDPNYTNGKVIVARSYVDLLDYRDIDYSPRDLVGHGTALAMVSAGVRNAGPKATIQGIAPHAWIGVYKIFGTPGYNDSANDAAIIKAIDEAVADGMDVLNLSFGSVFAPRLEDDIETDAVKRATDAGVIVVCAAGNSGPDLNTISSPGTAPSAITVGAISNGRTFSTGVFVDGLGAFSALPSSALAPAAPVSGVLADVATLDGNGLACTASGQYSSGAALQGKIALILRGTCTFQEKLNNVRALGAVGGIIYAAPDSPSPIIMSVSASTLPSEMVSNSDGVALKAAISTNDALPASLNFTETAMPAKAGRLTDFGAAGPSIDLGIKPDLVAVGETVYTATQSLDYYADMYDDSGYITVNGTSFSSPMVAGAAALIKAARPGLTLDIYRSLLINSATPDVTPLSGDRATIQQTGAGMLNVLAALNSTVAAYPTSLSFGRANTLDQTVTLKVTNLGAAKDTFTLAHDPRAGSLTPTLPADPVEIEAGATAEIPVAFTAAEPEPGLHEGFLTITSTATSTAARVPYWFSSTSTVPASISFIDYPSSGRGTIYFRVLDAAGAPLLGLEPEVSASAGGRVGLVVSYDSEVPGLYGFTAIPANSLTATTFTIAAGEVTRKIAIGR